MKIGTIFELKSVPKEGFESFQKRHEHSLFVPFLDLQNGVHRATFNSEEMIRHMHRGVVISKSVEAISKYASFFLVSDTGAVYLLRGLLFQEEHGAEAVTEAVSRYGGIADTPRAFMKHFRSYVFDTHLVTKPKRNNCIEFFSDSPVTPVVPPRFDRSWIGLVASMSHFTAWTFCSDEATEDKSYKKLAKAVSLWSE